MLLPGLEDALVGEQTIEAVVRRVHRAGKGDFRIFDVEVDRGGRHVVETWVGEVSPVGVGQRVRGTGRYQNHPEYGRQFRLSVVIAIVPTDKASIISYLGSGVIEGIGPAFAEAIVEHFDGRGESVLDVLDIHPERVQEVPGIGPERAERITRGWLLSREVARMMIFLQSHGAQPTLAASIVRYYLGRNEDPMRVVRDEPYRLAIDVFGVGFATADIIARSVGVALDSLQRAQAAALHILHDVGRNGHTYMDLDELTGRTSTLIERPGLENRRQIRTAIEELGQMERVVLDPYDGELESTLFGPVLERRFAVFSPSVHAAEWGVAKRIAGLLGGLGRKRGETPARMQAHAERAIEVYETTHAVTLAPEQREAVIAAAVHPVVIVTGGPGTGKSTITCAIVKMFDLAGFRVRLAAPTGRAAARLGEVTGEQGCTTIHRLLQMQPGRRPEYNPQHPLDTDVLILDEASMFDLDLTRSVLEAIADGTRLVLVGDRDQLPSVRPGAVLRDLIASGLVHVVRLERIYRQGPGSAISLAAAAIMRGQLPKSSEDPGGEFFVIDRDGPEAAAATIEHLVATRIPAAFKIPAADVAVLVPQHRGPGGTIALNTRLQNVLNPKGREIVRGQRRFRVGDKVLQLRNNYDLEIWNGDLGLVDEANQRQAEIKVAFDGRTVTLDDEGMEDLTLAYAMSVHKMQGGQAPGVVIYLGTEHEHMLARNLFYTAVTRGQKLVVVVASRAALQMAVREQRRDVRRTRLTERLKAFAA